MLACIDYDGVIGDSIQQQINLLVVAQKIVNSGRVPTIKDLQTVQNLTFDGLAEHIGMPEVKYPEWRSVVQELIRSDETEVPLFLNIDKVLRTIREKYIIVIITSNLESAVNRVLKRENLSELVTKIYDGVSPANKTEKILAAATEFKVNLSSVYMIGDTRSDIKHGLKAGAKTIAVTYGYQSRETLAIEKPDFYADSPSEILTCLGL
jgi:phosphoglycolate phosphatase